MADDSTEPVEAAEAAASADTSKKKRWPWYAGGSVLAAAIIAVLIAWGTGMFAPPEEEAAAPPPRPSFTIRESTTPSPSEEGTEAPEVEIAVAIDSVNHMPYTPVWDPPDNGEGWWQIVDPEHGYPENGGTDYVLAHSCPGGTCAGDAIRALEPGDTFTYLGDLYVVEDKLEILKTEIGDQDIWTHDEGRLVVITCIIDPNTGDSTENDIIIATRAE